MGIITEWGAEACGHKRGEWCLSFHSRELSRCACRLKLAMRKYTQHRNCCRSFSRSSEGQPEDSILKPASLPCEWLSRRRQIQTDQHLPSVYLNAGHSLTNAHRALRPPLYQGEGRQAADSF